MASSYAYEAVSGPVEARAPREVSAGIRRLALAYLWITIATGAIVFSEPALYDVLMIGVIVILPVTGLAPSPAASLPISCSSPGSSPAASWR